MSEFLPVAILIFLLGLGGLEVAYWMFTRQAVSLALQDAARAGSTQHASPEAIATAFETGLLVLHASAGKNAAARLAASLQFKRSQVGAPPWRIEILQPTAQDFSTYGSHSLPIAKQMGMRAIDNDYQYEQQQSGKHAQGRSIYQANTLRLKLVYLHQPLVPGIAVLLRSIRPTSHDYASQAMQHGFLPMLRYMQLSMESHPLQWPALADGRVIIGATLPPPLTETKNQPLSCSGGWCLQSFRPTADTQTPENNIAPPTLSDSDSQADLPPTEVFPEEESPLC